MAIDDKMKNLEDAVERFADIAEKEGKKVEKEFEEKIDRLASRFDGIDDVAEDVAAGFIDAAAKGLDKIADLFDSKEEDKKDEE